MKGRRYCPLSECSCNESACAWFCEEEGKCAIALLPSTLDWLTRFAVTKPFEEMKDSCLKTNDITG